MTSYRLPIFWIIGAFMVAVATPVLAQVGVDVQGDLDLTNMLLSAIGAAFTVVGAVATWLVNTYVKDAAARSIINDALQRGLGALQQSVQQAIPTAKIAAALPAALQQYAPAVQYVLDHAGDELARLGVTPAAVAAKIEAELGLLNIKHNLALTASSATPDAPHPMSVVLRN